MATKDAAPDAGNPEGRGGDGAIAALLVVTVLQYASSSRLALSPSPPRRDLAVYWDGLLAARRKAIPPRIRSTTVTTWIAAFIGWASVTAAFLTVPPLRRLLPIDGAAGHGLAHAILAEADASARIARIESLPNRERERAATELAVIADGAADAATRLAAVNALARCPGGIEVLAELGLRLEFRLPALAALSEEKSPLAVSAIIELLPACLSPDERSAAFLGLARQGGSTAIQALMSAAIESRADSKDRSLAIDAIAEIGDPTAAALLVPWLRPAHPTDANEAILRVLGRLRDPGCTAAVVHFFHRSESSSARLAAIETLARLATPAALVALEAIRDDCGLEPERNAAAKALADVRRRRRSPAVIERFRRAPR